MANKLYFDIETIPAPKEQEATLRYLYDRKISKIDPESDREIEPFEKFFDKTALDGTYGRICTLAYAWNDEPAESLSGDEAQILRDFWKIAEKTDLFIGHNIRDFDLPFIMQRSVILGVKPTWNKFQEPGRKPWEMVKFLSFARYQNCPIFDTMWEWSNWVDKWSNKTIEHIALAMGIPTPKEGIDGSKVAEFYEAGKIKEICEYCKRDVETTRAVYKRMIFEGVESLPF